ncbi:DUF1467 family protein [Maritalea sp.]|uniref:DUF1467 family protein n=1 Tax=Maritalea sp. TaxID=2003361 RepID=UPI003EF7AB1A
MDLLSSIALYFVLWWLCLFIMLPIGVRAAHEDGQSVEVGHDPGAPTKPKLKLKMLLTTVLAGVLLYLLSLGLASEWLINYWS